MRFFFLLAILVITFHVEAFDCPVPPCTGNIAIATIIESPTAEICSSEADCIGIKDASPMCLIGKCFYDYGHS
uniref:Secreted protein n=1 Tax=Caenorhabditis tropicalis TaxID=1561998 RepID=A0A1I7T4Z4_9PELO